MPVYPGAFQNVTESKGRAKVPDADVHQVAAADAR